MDPLSLGYPSRYSKSTQKSQFFRIPSHLGIHLVTPKALKNLNFSRSSLTWVSIPLQQKHSKISTFQDPLSLGYPSRYTKSTQKSHLFRIPSYLNFQYPNLGYYDNSPSLCCVKTGISWSPRYTLTVQSDVHQFDAWADMTNDTRRDYQIKHTELFGGDVHLQQETKVSHRCYEAEECCYSSAFPEHQQIVSEGELGGIYQYSIDQPFVLLQQSTFSLPFVKANIQLEKYVGLINHFQEGTQKGKFERKYRIESDRFLPKGTVTIREAGRVVGQTQINAISQGEKQDLHCGNDPDVSFTRYVNNLSQQRSTVLYSIRLIIKNSKAKSIKYEYKEIISSTKFTLNPKNENEQLNQKIQIINDGFQIIDQELKSNEEQEFQYELLLEYQNNQDDD